MAVVLASRSPRRQELLKLVFPEFLAIPSGEEEDMGQALSPHQLVMALATQKANSVAESRPDTDLVIGCDTVVVSPGGEVFGIPKTPEEAAAMLWELSGRVHRVLTGCCLIQGKRNKQFFEETQVEFYPLSPAEIQAYLNTEEPFDKAGSYGIQGYGSLLVKGIRGDYFNVVGLPVARLSREYRVFMG